MSHAEDGSGVGSAIIALTGTHGAPSWFHSLFLVGAMTKIRKDAGLYKSRSDMLCMYLSELIIRTMCVV